MNHWTNVNIWKWRKTCEKCHAVGTAGWKYPGQTLSSIIMVGIFPRDYDGDYRGDDEHCNSQNENDQVWRIQLKLTNSMIFEGNSWAMGCGLWISWFYQKKYVFKMSSSLSLVLLSRMVLQFMKMDLKQLLFFCPNMSVKDESCPGWCYNFCSGESDVEIQDSVRGKHRQHCRPPILE